MRTIRYEIIFEHSQSDEGPWKEYGFLYKPWNENHSLPFTGKLFSILHNMVILQVYILVNDIVVFSGPYFARFDHKFYDAATAANYRNEPWIISLVYRLLQNEQNVLRLFGISTNIMPAPKFVRASLYKFQFTTSSTRYV